MAPTIKVGQYILKKKIGEGAFAEVRLAVHESTGEEFAVKVFDRSALPRSDLERDVKREIKIMQYLRHPGIVSIHAALVTETKMYLVMELVRGGELYDEIVSKRRVDEKTARRYFQQIVDAMVYCHKRGVVHRDLKPENILLTDEGNVKITDFGMSWMKEAVDVDGERKAKQLLKTQCGTAKYMAPETIVRSSAGYDGEKVDAWECGMVLYALLAGYLPFNGEDDNSVFQSILKGKLRFPSHFSPGAKDVLHRLLEKNPAKRATLPEIREHLWFLVDYKVDPTILNTSKASRKMRGTKTSWGSDSSVAQREKDSTTGENDKSCNENGHPSTLTNGSSKAEASSMAPFAGAEKAKLGQNFKKNRARSKSRGRLSQRIRQGALAVVPVVQDDNMGDLQFVKPVSKSVVTGQGVRFLGATHPEEERATEEIVDADTEEPDSPTSKIESAVSPSPFGDTNTEADLDMAQTMSHEPEPTPTSPTSARVGISVEDVDSVGIRGKDVSVTDRAAPSSLVSPTSKKPTRHGGGGHAALNVPSLGVGAGFGVLFSRSRDSTADEGMDVDDSPSPVSLGGRRKGPLAGMLRSILSIDKVGTGPGSGGTEEGPRLNEGSSWFATSPVSDRATVGTRAEAKPFLDKNRTGEESEGLVSSFKFRKRRAHGGHGLVHLQGSSEMRSTGT